MIGPATLLAVHTGRVAPLGPNGVPSGYVKRRREGTVEVRALGLDGDEQADLTVHGGPDKAVYCYPSEGYPPWAADFPALAERLTAPAMGENLSTGGLDETTVHIGDIFRIGGALVQVTQPRQPCFKLALALGEPRLPKAMLRTQRCGWYLRVIEGGPVTAGDSIELVARENPDWSVARFARLIADKRMDREILSEMVGMPGLAEQWRLKALRLLADS